MLKAPMRDPVLNGYVLLSTPWVAMDKPIVENVPCQCMMPGLALNIMVDKDTGQPYDFSVKTQQDKA